MPAPASKPAERHTARTIRAADNAPLMMKWTFKIVELVSGRHACGRQSCIEQPATAQS